MGGYLYRPPRPTGAWSSDEPSGSSIVIILGIRYFDRVGFLWYNRRAGRCTLRPERRMRRSNFAERA